MHDKYFIRSGASILENKAVEIELEQDGDCFARVVTAMFDQFRTHPFVRCLAASKILLESLEQIRELDPIFHKDQDQKFLDDYVREKVIDLAVGLNSWLVGKDREEICGNTSVEELNKGIVESLKRNYPEVEQGAQENA